MDQIKRERDECKAELQRVYGKLEALVTLRNSLEQEIEGLLIYRDSLESMVEFKEALLEEEEEVVEITEEEFLNK